MQEIKRVCSYGYTCGAHRGSVTENIKSNRISSRSRARGAGKILRLMSLRSTGYAIPNNTPGCLGAGKFTESLSIAFRSYRSDTLCALLFRRVTLVQIVPGHTALKLLVAMLKCVLWLCPSTKQKMISKDCETCKKDHSGYVRLFILVNSFLKYFISEGEVFMFLCNECPCNPEQSDLLSDFIGLEKCEYFTGRWDKIRLHPTDIFSLDSWAYIDCSIIKSRQIDSSS